MTNELPNPENFQTVSSYKEAVYDLISEGVPTWIFDMKLSIKYKEAHDKELSEPEKILRSK